MSRLFHKETDSFFCQLFKQWPQTLFELLGLPVVQAKSYRFDSVEVKKSFRIDGLFVPNKFTLPLYFVEVQFQRVQTFYANLFAKVFSYLEENDPKQEWIAVAIFPSRKEEPRHLSPYEDLLGSKRVKRVYLDEVPVSDDPPLGLGILQLLSASFRQAVEWTPKIVERRRVEFVDSESHAKVIELVEGLLIQRFPLIPLEEIRKMFQLTDIRKTRAFKEAYEIAYPEAYQAAYKEIKEAAQKHAKEAAQKAMDGLVEKLAAKGMTHKEIAELLEIPVREVRRLAKEHSS